MNFKRYATGGSLVFALACGGTTSPALSPRHESVAIDAHSRQLAPDLAARVDHALQAAQQAAADGDDSAKRDHEAQAHLWRTALRMEVQRIGLARQQQTALSEIEALETQRVADEAERAQLEQELRRHQAAEIARAEAARVLLEAETDEAQRRGGDAARIATRREASRALVDRASAVLAAAVALGASEATHTAARTAIDVARKQLDGSATGITAAHKAFGLAQRALGDARAKRPGPDAHELASLLAALSEQGFTAEHMDDGVVIWLADLFTTRAELRAGAKVLLATLGALLSAHPHGPIQVHALTTPPLPRAVATQRAQRVKAALGVQDTTRVTTGESANGSDHNNLMRVTLPAYGRLP